MTYYFEAIDSQFDIMDENIYLWNEINAISDVSLAFPGGLLCLFLTMRLRFKLWLFFNFSQFEQLNSFFNAFFDFAVFPRNSRDLNVKQKRATLILSRRIEDFEAMTLSIECGRIGFQNCLHTFFAL